MGECLNRHYVRTKFRPNPRGQAFFCVDLTWNDPIVNVLADTHFSFLSFLNTAPTHSFFSYIMVLNLFFTTSLAKLYQLQSQSLYLNSAGAYFYRYFDPFLQILDKILAWCACPRPRSSKGFSAGAV